MSEQSIDGLQRYLRRLCDEAVPPDDSLLLKRFVSDNDREAFEFLIARHGPMVLGTARRLVNNSHDAEDVFQAVFLSLARLAKTIRQGATLPAWLHRTTCRVASKVRKHRDCGAIDSPTEPSENVEPAAQLVWQEVRHALDEELDQLPERFRSPLLLCYLSGLTRDEAAKQLGWSLGTLKRRLEEGRRVLRLRLDRRGIASVGLALTVLTPDTLQATVSKTLLESSLHAVFTKGAVVPETIRVLDSAYALKGHAMKPILAALAVFAIGIGIYASTSQDDPPKPAATGKVKPAEPQPVVQMDDPLPAGAALRFGTSRFRQGKPIVAMAVSRDGQKAFVDSGGFDLVTGRPLFGLDTRDAEAIALSPDEQTIVIKQNLVLYVRDAKTGKTLRSINLPKVNPRSEGDALAFTPNGKAIATISDGKDLHLIDFESGKTIRDFVHETESANSFPQVLAVSFSPDGKLMATGGYSKEKDNYFARIWEVETGKELRHVMHGQRGYGIRSLAFSPDGKTLATLGTQSGAFLRLFDVETGKEKRAFPKDSNERVRRGTVAFSPDGKTVAAACASIRLYDTTTGEERLRIDRRASDLHFSDGGKILAAAVSGAIYRWDTATGKPLTPESAADAVAAQILVSADGSKVVTRGHYGDTNIWDGVTGKRVRGIQTGWQQNLALSPNGRFLAWSIHDPGVTYPDPHDARSSHEGSRIRLYDIAADKAVDRFPTFKGNAHDLAFMSDGKNLVTVDSVGGTVRTWNVETGKEERSFVAMPVIPKGKALRVQRAILSPFGDTVALTYSDVDTDRTDRLGRLANRPHQVRLWDVATGKQLPVIDSYPVDGAFSPDGRLIVTAGGNAVYETATGRRVAAFPDEPYVKAAAFSRDSRFLATAVHDRLIQIWEVATWTKRYEFKGHGNESIALAFGPGGQLFVGNPDTTVLAWPMRTSPTDKSVSLEKAWYALAKWESAESFKAEGRFLATPSDAVKFLAETVELEEAIDAKRVQRLLADLGSDEFAVREAASKHLLELNPQSIPHLETALRNTTSAEVRERLEKILEQKRRVAIRSEQVRLKRAVMVLERIGNDEAKILLKKWAGGPAGALLTIEASAALDRLKFDENAIR